MSTRIKVNLYFFFLITAVVLLTGCGSTQEKKQTPPKQSGQNRQMAIRADAFIVKKVTITDKIDIPGTLVAN